MPVYQFTAPTGTATLEHKAEIAGAVTRVHSELTGAPARYVHCSFDAMPAGSIYIAGEETTSARMIGLIRSGRSEALRGRLIHGIADAWSEITGEPTEALAIFLHEIPGANAFEYGAIMPDADQDPGAVLDDEPRLSWAAARPAAARRSRAAECRARPGRRSGCHRRRCGGRSCCLPARRTRRRRCARSSPSCPR